MLAQTNGTIAESRLSLTDQQDLQIGWQQITLYAAEYMETSRIDGARVWSFDTREQAKEQARRLAAAQWNYYRRHINEFCGGPELR